MFFVTAKRAEVKGAQAELVVGQTAPDGVAVERAQILLASLGCGALMPGMRLSPCCQPAAAHPDLTFGALNAKLGELYKALSPEEKAPYEVGTAGGDGEHAGVAVSLAASCCVNSMGLAACAAVCCPDSLTHLLELPHAAPQLQVQAATDKQQIGRAHV